MAFATINKGASYFNTVTYTGDGTTPRTLTGVGFKPDFSWTKRRDSGQGNTNHNLYNNVVGAGNNSELASNTTGEEGGSDANLYGYVSAFTSDGFTLTDGTNATYKNLYTNNSGGTYVAWNWLANNTSGSSNTAGSITATVAANTTAGFSVGKTTGTLSSGTITVGHGMGVAPSMILWKRTDGVSNWQVYHKSTGVNLTQLNTTGAVTSGTNYWGTPTSTTFTVESPLYGAAETYVFYAFAEIKGYSKFGSYTGNGSANGTFIYTGFKPAFIMIKRTDTIEEWQLTDAKRNVTNGANNASLKANSSAAETVNSTWTLVDLLSNGFKQRYTDSLMNASGGTYIYMAFAENPFVLTDGTPVTAR
jgi:hypothetical protein